MTAMTEEEKMTAYSNRAMKTDMNQHEFRVANWRKGELMNISTEEGMQPRYGATYLGLGIFPVTLGTSKVPPIENVTHLATGLRLFFVQCSELEASEIMMQIAEMGDWSTKSPDEVLLAKVKERIASDKRIFTKWRAIEIDKTERYRVSVFCLPDDRGHYLQRFDYELVDSQVSSVIYDTHDQALRAHRQNRVEWEVTLLPICA